MRAGSLKCFQIHGWFLGSELFDQLRKEEFEVTEKGKMLEGRTVLNRAMDMRSKLQPLINKVPTIGVMLPQDSEGMVVQVALQLMGKRGQYKPGIHSRTAGCRPSFGQGKRAFDNP